MKQKGSACRQAGFIPILIIILLAAAALGGYLIYQNQTPSTLQPRSGRASSEQAKPTPSPQPSPLSTEAPAKVEDPTANWKTYATDKFTFRYPPDFVVEERIKDFLVIIPSGITPAPQQGISVDARLTGSYTDFNKAINATKKDLKNIQVNNITNGVKITGEAGPGVGENLLITTALLQYKQGAISVEYLVTQPEITTSLFDQILSTFQFTQ